MGCNKQFLYLQSAIKDAFCFETVLKLTARDLNVYTFTFVVLYFFQFSFFTFFFFFHFKRSTFVGVVRVLMVKKDEEKGRDPAGKFAEKVVWRSVFDYKALRIKCRFNKNSLLRCCFLAILLAGEGQQHLRRRVKNKCFFTNNCLFALHHVFFNPLNLL